MLAISVVREKFDEYIFQEILKYASNAELKGMLLTSVEGARNSSAPQLSVEDDKTVSSYLSDVREEKYANCITLQNKT